ncbi:Putative membrane bound O-acyl transferase, MBOAT, diacylglycerol O-acyltransferase 1 [Septoria linicola]|uniref:O-acyltransferase n=1 Tax=Septoria linicola TaxID=215465 RepID=A0A9Q9AMT1_9PEZI|nr:Putative membrane bound O-acyl transferase, MBOAT, diacylglycerol O-acyltransferase 1 [Septoria linicola]
MASATSTSVHVANGDVAQLNGSVRKANGSVGSPNGSTLVDTGVQKRSSSRDPRSSSKKYKHTFAVHSTTRPSVFSQDAPTAPSTLGFRNLMALVIIVSNLRLMIDNYSKYGLLVAISGGSKVKDGDWKWFIILYILTPCHLFVAYWIEWGAARYVESVVARMKREGRIGAEQIIKEERKKSKSLFSTWTAIAVSHALNATFMLAFATYVVYYWIHNPGLGTITELHAVVVWLKVCSYAFTNRDLRQSFVRSDAASELPDIYNQCPYPQNINFLNLCYFWWAPTLVYQPVYPRSEKIRKDFVIKRFVEFFALCILIWITCAQYAVPLLNNSVDEIANLRGIKILERVMKLSTISLVCWLAGFFALFQSFLNFLAEIMRFGDREFYGDWWNSSDVRSYWTSWNKPVTHFMKRHIYSPMVGRGVPPVIAQILTFLFSGLLHEALVGVPTHSILGVAFFGMIGQIPLIILTDMIMKIGGKGPNARLIGNCTFWLTFCIFGQPLAALAYFFAWQAKYGAGIQIKPLM